MTSAGVPIQGVVKRLLSAAQRGIRDRALSVLDTARVRLSSWGRPDRLTDAPVLLPLAPAYDPDKHAFYVDLIEDALSKSHEGVLNIALSGGYGVGKSSILSEVARRHRDEVISISLSTLGFPEDEPQPAGRAAKAASTKTNRIQKEIVKQLLYSVRPGRMPGSSYRRATRLPVIRVGAYAALVGLVVATVFLLTGWGVRAAEALGVEAETWTITAAVGLLAAAIVFPLLGLFHHRLQLNGVEAGGTTISLSAKSATYFDEYLDEIVYFFEVVKRDIVIFEDIDRFNDPHIFETLRSLNAILNGAKQLRGRRVRFIYAIKDSIFDRLGERAAEIESEDDSSPHGPDTVDTESESEAARANRTKFFEVVIPVVPFVTHRSARDLLSDTLGDELKSKIPKELLDLAGKHVADMRLIKNIRNEYAVFEKRVLGASELDLDEKHLLAMMLYKSTHLRDFELIKLGDSPLDELYRKSRELIEDAVESIDAELREKRRLRRQATLPAERAQALGAALIEYGERVLRHSRALLNLREGVAAWKLGDRTVTSELATPAFWEEFAASDESLSATALRANSSQQYSFVFSREDIARALRTRIDPASVIAAERERLDGEIARLEAERDDLLSADMAELTSFTRFRIDEDGEKLTFDELVDRYLTSPLARELLRAGYIDRNFTLYTSPFYTNLLTEAAANYLMKNVDRNRSDLNFRLEGKDVRLLIEERGYSLLATPAGMNINVMDYLLESDGLGANTLVDHVLKVGEQGRSFMLAYFASGAVPERLVEILTPRWDRIVAFLVEEADVEDARRLSLIDTALKVLSSDVVYATGSEVASELAESYRVLPVFISEETSEDDAAAIGALVKSAGAQIGELSVLGSNVRRAIVEQSVYPVDRANLVSALDGADDGLSLDVIKDTSETVYEHALRNIEGYLRALNDAEPTVLRASAFPEIVARVADIAPAHLEEVASRASEECIVEDLEDVGDHSAAPVLARLGRFRASFRNVTAYLAWNEGEVDADLVALLAGADALADVDNAEEAEKVALALKLVQVRDLAPLKRAKLIESLDLANFLNVAQVPVEAGDLFAELVRYSVIEDGADTYSALDETNWATREAYIRASNEFKTFATPELVGSDLASLLTSAVVGDEVKDAVSARADAYAVVADSAGLKALAAYAVQRGGSVNIETIQAFAKARVGESSLLALLAPLLPSLGMTQLSPLLLEIGGEYKKLAGATGKRPLIPKTSDTEALVARLTELGVVSKSGAEGHMLRVNMRKPRDA